ncbi:hypothetical protein CAEBREN_02854 [Caenorhabditis brenneri]|uniref:SET domain-containing protein n=1 Tax=Caenorhabditis brenneri TaxID=135651 RepID=G0MMD8_CAEBE|nr:hypothetical protein CAEBREN_02854 [Caenorhabditis brenneri]
MAPNKITTTPTRTRSRCIARKPQSIKTGRFTIAQEVVEPMEVPSTSTRMLRPRKDRPVNGVLDKQISTGLRDGLDGNKADRSKLPVAIVIHNGSDTLKCSDRIKIVTNVSPEIINVCEEARRAHAYGAIKLPRSYPGVASRKFSEDQEEMFAKKATAYPIQVAFEKRGCPGKWLVYFEGWADPYEYTEEKLGKDGEESLEIAKVHAEFLGKLEKMGVDADMARRARFHKDHKPDSVFWDFEDVSYFHSMEQDEAGLGGIKYVNLKKENSKKEPIYPPKFHYTTVNVIDSKVYNYCLRFNANQSFAQLTRGKKSKKGGSGGGGCENPAGCVCDQLFEILYHNSIQNLQTTKDGFLDLTTFDRDSRRISIECSDLCGCSSNCPRRHLQRGCQKPVVVYYEDDVKEYGVRAAREFKAGEFIAEYVGTLKMENDSDDNSYEAECGVMGEKLVICSKEHGNFARFLSHSCGPNAAFVITHSRRFETDPLLPRIAVFAIKDIDVGEEVTISYWSKKELEKARKAKKGVRCKCHTPECSEYLPL